MFKNNIDKLEESLSETKKLEEIVKNEILMDLINIDNSVIETSNLILNNFPNTFYISLSPEYYNTESQLYRIFEYLNRYDSILDIKNKIKELITNEKIDYLNYSILLNEVVLYKLKEILKKLEKIE